MQVVVKNTIEMKEIYIRFFENKESQNSPKSIGLLDWLTTDAYKSQIEAIRQCKSKEESDRLKSKLPCSMPSMRMDGSHSGYIAIDVDGKDNPGVTASQMKDFISSVSTVSFCGYSASGGGVWALVPIMHKNKHYEHWQALNLFFLNNGLTIDNKCTNINRLRFASYDPEPYVNENAENFRMLWVDAPATKVKFTHPDFVKGENVFEKFNREADVVGLLRNHGWKVEKEIGNKTHLTRPDKKGGVSGTLFNDTKIFHLFTSNSGLSKTDYNPFDLYAELEYNNDKKKLLAMLRKENI